MEVHRVNETDGVRDRAEGQILVLFAGSLLFLIVLVGLVIDGGNAFLNRRDAQNTADLASLAGTKVVADLYVKGSSPITVYNAVEESVQGNNCEGATAVTPCTWTADYVDLSGTSLGRVTTATMMPSGTLGVSVQVNRQPRTFFLGLPPMSMTAWNVSTTATAMTFESVNLAPQGALLPIGWRAPDSYLNPPGGVYVPQVYRLTDGALDVPGNFGWLSWDGSGDTPTLAGWVCSPSNPEITLPDYIDGNTGASNSNDIRDCLQRYIDQKIPVLIPIIVEANPMSACPNGPVYGQGSHSEYCMIGLVSLTLTSITTDSNVAIKNVEGFVTRTYAIQPGVVEPNAGAGPPSLNSQFYYLGLVK